jgi:arylsulfatase A-like enzyme
MIVLVGLFVACFEPSAADGSRSAAYPLESARIVPGPRGDALVFGDTPRNLLVISLDTTRRDRVGLLSDRDTTPNFDAVFSDGVVLADHRSCSNWTAPSSYCAQSGRSHLDDDVWLTSGGWGSRDHRVDWPPNDMPTLASILSDAGFDTTLVTTNSHFSSAYNGNGYGFDREIKRYWQRADVALDAAITASEDLGADGDPWYLHVHFFDPHSPYVAPREYWTDPDLECPWSVASVNTQYRLEGGFVWRRLDTREQARARECLLNVYEGGLRYWDEHFAAMWSDFDSRGLLDDTLVVFWTDHGESFGEHDDLFVHGVSLYDTENAATAAFWAKDIEPLRWTGPTTHQDLAPTILRALDVPLGDHTGTVLGHARHDRVRVGFNYLRGNGVPIVSAVQSDKKLMYWWDGRKRFYDLAVDPDEENDLYNPSDSTVIALWEKLQPIVEHTDEVWPRLNPTAIGP